MSRPEPVPFDSVPDGVLVAFSALGTIAHFVRKDAPLRTLCGTRARYVVGADPGRTRSRFDVCGRCAVLHAQPAEPRPVRLVCSTCRAVLPHEESTPLVRALCSVCGVFDWCRP